VDTLAFIDYLVAQTNYSSQIAHIEHIPSRDASFAELDSPLETELEESLKKHKLLPL